MINNLRSKINWKAVAIIAGVIFAINIDTEEKYPVANALGVATGYTLVALPYALIVSKGEKDFTTN